MSKLTNAQMLKCSRREPVDSPLAEWDWAAAGSRRKYSGDRAEETLAASDRKSTDPMDTAEAFLQHQQWLWAVVYARLGNRSDTDDVLQEISVAAVQFDLRAQEIQNIKGWLYQVAVRQVMLFRRREGRYRRRLKTFAELQPEHATSLPWSATQDAWENDLERVRAAMTRIRPSDRQVLVLKYKNGLRCREIAMHMGVKESTIQSRLLRARRRLRALLVNHETDGKERANG